MDTKRKNIVFVLMLFLLTFGSFFCRNATASAEVNDKKIEFKDTGFHVDGKLYHYRYVTKDLKAIHSIIYRTIAFVVEKKPTHGKPTGYKNKNQVLPLDSKHCYVVSESGGGYVYSYYYWTDAQMNAAFKAAGVSAKSLQASGGNVYFNAVFNVYYRSGSSYTYRSGPHYSQAAIRSAEDWRGNPTFSAHYDIKCKVAPVNVPVRIKYWVKNKKGKWKNITVEQGAGGSLTSVEYLNEGTATYGSEYKVTSTQPECLYVEVNSSGNPQRVLSETEYAEIKTTINSKVKELTSGKNGAIVALKEAKKNYNSARHARFECMNNISISEQNKISAESALSDLGYNVDGTKKEATAEEPDEETQQQINELLNNYDTAASDYESYTAELPLLEQAEQEAWEKRSNAYENLANIKLELKNAQKEKRDFNKKHKKLWLFRTEASTISKPIKQVTKKRVVKKNPIKNYDAYREKINEKIQKQKYLVDSWTGIVVNYRYKTYSSKDPKPTERKIEPVLKCEINYDSLETQQSREDFPEDTPAEELPFDSTVAIPTTENQYIWIKTKEYLISLSLKETATPGIDTFYENNVWSDLYETDIGTECQREGHYTKINGIDIWMIKYADVTNESLPNETDAIYIGDNTQRIIPDFTADTEDGIDHRKLEYYISSKSGIKKQPEPIKNSMGHIINWTYYVCMSDMVYLEDHLGNPVIDIGMEGGGSYTCGEKPITLTNPSMIKIYDESTEVFTTDKELYEEGFKIPKELQNGIKESKCNAYFSNILHYRQEEAEEHDIDDTGYTISGNLSGNELFSSQGRDSEYDLYYEAAHPTEDFIELCDSLSINSEDNPEDINSVNILTPVVCDGKIEVVKKYNQRLNPAGEDTPQIVLDHMFNVQLPTYGIHADYDGYGEQDFLRYTKRREVKFPFDVYSEDKSVYYKANEWIELVQDTTTFYLPTWVDETLDDYYDVKFRTHALNCTMDIIQAEELANVTGGKFHAAADRSFVDVSGSVFDLKLYDISDYPFWKNVFREGDSLKTTDFRYFVGDKDKNGDNTGADAKYTFPLFEGSHPNYINRGAVKPGYVWRFSVKTIGNYIDGADEVNVDTNGDGVADVNIDTNEDHEPDVDIDINRDGIPDMNIDSNGDGIADKNKGRYIGDFVRIIPRFYYLKSDGTRREVDVWYNATGKNNKKKYLVRAGDERDATNRKSIQTGDVYTSIPDEELERIKEITGKDILEIKDTVYDLYSYGKINVQKGTRTYIGDDYLPNGTVPTVEGETEEETEALTEKFAKRINISAQKWYFKYSLPSDIHICEKDFDVIGYGDEHGGIDFAEDFWLNGVEGYLDINFDVLTIKGSSGTCIKQKYIADLSDTDDPVYCDWYNLNGEKIWPPYVDEEVADVDDIEELYAYLLENEDVLREFENTYNNMDFGEIFSSPELAQEARENMFVNGIPSDASDEEIRESEIEVGDDGDDDGQEGVMEKYDPFVEGTEYLSYINKENAENGYCNMWQMENFDKNKKDADNKGYKLDYGDVLFCYIDGKSAEKDYISAGTN